MFKLSRLWLQHSPLWPTFTPKTTAMRLQLSFLILAQVQSLAMNGKALLELKLRAQVLTHVSALVILTMATPTNARTSTRCASPAMKMTTVIRTFACRPTPCRVTVTASRKTRASRPTITAGTGQSSGTPMSTCRAM